MFGNVIQHFDGVFAKNTTYKISNATIREVNKRFLNVHPKIELEQQMNTIVTQATASVNKERITYNFINYSEVSYIEEDETTSDITKSKNCNLL